MQKDTETKPAHSGENVPGVPKLIQDLYLKHGGTPPTAAVKTNEDMEVEGNTAEDAAAAQSGPTATLEEKREKLKQAQALLAGLGLGFDERFAEAEKQLAPAAAAAKSKSSLKDRLDASERFQRNAQKELEDREKKVERIQEELAKAQRQVAESRQRLNVATAVHREAFNAYRATLPDEESRSRPPSRRSRATTPRT